MLRTQIVKLARASPLQARSFSVIAARSKEGDIGGTRFGGTSSGDSMKKREDAAESQYIRQKEMESVRRLKEHLNTQRKHLDALDKHIQELEKEKHGEGY